MLFSSLTFLLYFFPIITIVYFLVPKTLKNPILLIGSLFFYAWGEPVYIVLMIFSIMINYFIGIKIGKCQDDDDQKGAKNYLVLACIVCLALLFYFKYFNFTIDMIDQITGLDLPNRKIALPIGISFYSFQILSYIIDVYRGKVKAQHNLIDFGLFVSLFPQLIAGPIVRYSTIEYELHNREVTFVKIQNGLERFMIGLGKKVLLANTFGAIWNEVFNGNLSNLSLGTAWLALMCYSLQIYFDFSGYSDMAIGLGKIYGFDFLENFNVPYVSKSISDFWRRWHISLSSWFKEYVYIPLGGNRKGYRRQIINIIIVWTLTGLWHGASLNFIIWGAYYAMMLIIEKIWLRKWLEKAPAVITHIYALFFIMIGWLIFECVDLNRLVPYLGAMFNFSDLADMNFFYILRNNIFLLIVGVVISIDLHHRFTGWLAMHKPNTYFVFKLALCTFVLGLSFIYLVDSTYNPFIYFRF